MYHNTTYHHAGIIVPVSKIPKVLLLLLCCEGGFVLVSANRHLVLYPAALELDLLIVLNSRVIIVFINGLDEGWMMNPRL